MADETIWIGDLRISDRTARHLSTKHGLEATAVRDAIQCVKGLPFVWDEDPERGTRAIIRVSIGRRPCDVVVYPVGGHAEDDAWNLGSTYPLD